VTAVLVVACAPRQPPVEPPGPPTDPQAAAPVVAADEPADIAHPARIDLPTETSPSALVVHGERLVWIDTAGSLWTMWRAGVRAPALRPAHARLRVSGRDRR
jgi:hypothetical protein